MNIISLAGDTYAGLRIDDVLLFACGVLFTSVVLCSFDLRVRRLEAVFVVWIAILLLSNALNLFFYHRSNPLYSLRFVEYFLLFSLRILLFEEIQPPQSGHGDTWINAPILALQMAGIIGGLSAAGYVPKVNRGIGLTGGPWEIGVVINFCLAILIFDRDVTTRSAYELSS